MMNTLKLIRQDPKGRVVVPILLALGGVPLGVVFLIWLFFFRG